MFLDDFGVLLACRVSKREEKQKLWGSVLEVSNTEKCGKIRKLQKAQGFKMAGP